MISDHETSIYLIYCHNKNYSVILYFLCFCALKVFILPQADIDIPQIQLQTRAWVDDLTKTYGAIDNNLSANRKGSDLMLVHLTSSILQ